MEQFFWTAENILYMFLQTIDRGRFYLPREIKKERRLSVNPAFL